MNIIHSLVYIRENISNMLNIEDYNDHIFINEIERILETNDSYYIKSLKGIVKDAIEEYANNYWRYNIKHTDESHLFDKKEFINKRTNEFWTKIKS